MRVLIVGGTNFIGPHIVAALQNGGHEVTVFNRGTAADRLQDVERLKGDRVKDDLDALRGRSFDATVDTCGYFPRAVEAVLDALGDPGFYCFLSTISVYASFSEHDQDESAPLATTDAPLAEAVTPENYGALKVLCEDVVRTRCADRAIPRLGLVVGPGDPTDRFTYWPVRVSQGGRILVPGSRHDLLQWIDARDVAAFVRRVIEDGTSGTFNVVTPPGAMTFGGVLDAASALSKEPAELVWLSSEQLEEYELRPWIDFPAWMPSDGEDSGFATFSSERAQAEGLGFTPLGITVKDIVDWWSKLPDERTQLRAGLGREREREILTLLQE